jgi:solute carrier family 13 (sodium-dependent dicarboxylate transporter), member 2/3/5
VRPLVTVTVVACAIVVAALGLIEDPLQARAVLVAGLYLTFALSEIVAPFVPTLFLLVSAPLLLGPLSQSYALGNVLRWAADPVLALFAGGLALGLAAQRHGVDAALAALLLRAAGSSRRGLLAVTLLAATFLSMWLSNVAAAALLFAALRPALAAIEPGFRRSLLVALAMGANLGGVTTPIGSGPNAIAIAETRAVHPIAFAEWMGFGVPIAAGMCAVAYAWLVLRYRVTGPSELRIAPPEALTRRGYGVLIILAAGIIAWLSEPLHGVGAASIALALMLALFGSSLLGKADLGALDWSTLGLIAGGLVLGRLLESSGILAAIAHAVPIADSPRWLWLGALVGVSAVLSALMSNTATAAMLVPLGMQIDGAASTAVIIAVATSFGMPLPISTPPNALIYGTGMIRSRDLLEIGLGLMLIGCVVVTLSGSWFLGYFGLR